MTFAREGIPFILIALAFAALGYTAALMRRSWLLWLVAFILTLLVLWVAYFFRDPERTGPRGEQLVISPADGRVIDISEVDEPAFLQGRAIRISVFMNVFNVHVNRAPIDGTVVKIAYRPGLFLNASLDKASDDNERNAVRMAAKDGREIACVQIAGLIARRILCDIAAGDTLPAGRRIGMIRFGSRVDVYLPPGVEPLVAVGQTMVAGETVIADMASAETRRDGAVR